MTDILCKWLNNEVKLSTAVDTTNFTREFCTGYLIGEVLHKYQLQDDFDKFSQSRNADSKLNNFTRVEPVLHLLEIPFDTNVARDIMTEKHGVATRLLYQLFIALNKKQKNNLTGVAMETMRPAAPVKLENVESLIYKERLKHMTPRQTDLDLEALVEHYHQKQVQMESVAFKERFEEEEKHLRKVQEQRDALRAKHQEERARKSEMLAKIQAATVHIPKPPPNKTAKAIAQKDERRKVLQSEAMQRDIDVFEAKLKRTLPPSKPIGDDAVVEVAGLPDSVSAVQVGSNDTYIMKIRNRLNEDQSARGEREKRRRKVIVDQLQAHEAQEEARREEMLVNRLMRQSQQERRIAVQLLQARHEKEIICKNREMREKQYEDRRNKEFQEALNREAEMAAFAKVEYMDQTKKDQELHNSIMADRAQAKYSQHYDMCSQVLGDVVDFSTKIGEYRELTNKQLPAKLMREWTELFTKGWPLYEVEETRDSEEETPTPEQILEEERQQLLDEGDFNEFRNMIGAWQPPDGCEIACPPRNNPIVGHIVQRLLNIVHPPTPPPPAPEFPPFPIKACVLGKLFSGKSTTSKMLVDNHRLHILDCEKLVVEAIDAHKNGEVIEEPQLVEVEEVEEMDVTLPAAPDEAATDPTTSSLIVEQVAGTESVQSKPVTPQTGSVKATDTPTDNKSQDSKSLIQDSSSLIQDSKSQDGTEKTDPEKPVPEDEQADVDSMATDRAKLGQKAMRYLKKGKTVDDQLLVDILVEAIRRIPEGTGYIVDGFPSTYAQAKLFEKALTGLDAGLSQDNLKANQKDQKEAKGKGKKSSLAPDPKPAPPPPEPTSGIDVVILFDLPDETALKRSAGRCYATQEEQEYQQEFKPPPEGSATGVGKQEKVIPVEDLAHDQEQVQHRLTTFQDSWPKLEKWFTRFGSLHKVDVSQEHSTVFLEVETILEQTLKKLQGPPPEETLVIETTEEPIPEPEKPPTPQEDKPPEKPEEGRSRPSSKKGSRSGSAKRSGSRGSSSDKKAKKSPRSGSKTETTKKSAKGSRGSSPKSPKRSKSGKKAKTPEPEPEPEPEVPPGTPPPQPGSDLWEYVDQAIDEELAHILSPQWETAETTYVDASKLMFRNIRDEREQIIRYLFHMKQDYLAYLRRPDHKQEFVTQWQQDFNLVSDDLRQDEETRGELHQRVDDIRERLWSICDERKEQAEQEREDTMKEGWLEDHVGVLTNHYTTLLQGEVDRFQDTLRLLKDYYKGMEGKIPDELQPDYIRLPLVELPTELPAEDEAGEGVADESVTSEPPAEDAKPQSGKATPSGKKKKEEEEPEDKKLIPLVPRRPASPDTAGTAKGKQDKSKPKGKDAEDAPPPPTDPDEKLVYDGFITGVQAMDRIVHMLQKIAAEQAAREAEEELEREREREREAERVKAAADSKKKGKGKGGRKSRSPSPKKGKGKETPTTQPTPPPDTAEDNEEEQLKKQMREKAKQEFFAALLEETGAAKTRMDLCRAVGYEMIRELKTKADCSYKDMNDWLGARFLKEMESIDQMSEVMRFAVENGTKIRQELNIQQEAFYVNEDMKVLRSPSPELRQDAVEPVEQETFTVEQIMSIYSQFALTAPSGMLSLKAFQDVFSDLTALTHGTEQVPEMWHNLGSEKLEALALSMSGDGEYIDWRSCLLQMARPWPVPTQSDLLETLTRLQDMDQAQTGYVTREQYERVDLWFKGQSKPATPDDPSQPAPFDRLSSLKAAFFDKFADHTSEPSQLDYVSLLMYFSISPDPYEGFLRALSVASGTHMPRLPNKRIVIKKPSRPGSQTSLANMSDVETERGGADEEVKLPDDIPQTAEHALVPLDALDKVLHHGQNMRGDSHRFSVTTDPEDAFSRERLAGVYQELGNEDLEPIALSALIEHPVIQDVVATCNTYRGVDLKLLLSQFGGDNADTQSLKIGE